MYLTDHILLQWMGREFSIIERRGTAHPEELCGVLLLNEKTETENGWIYIVPLSARKSEIFWAAAAAGAFYVFLDEIPSAMPETISSVRLEKGIDPVDVMNCLSRAVAFYMKWEKDIDMMIRNTASLSFVLEEALHVFHNPLQLYRRDMSVIAQAIPSSIQHSEEFRFWMLEQGAERMEIVNAILQDPQFIGYQEQDLCYPGPEHIIGVPSLFYNIKENHKTGFMLCLIGQDSKPGPAESDLLRILAEKLRKLLSSTQQRSEGNRKRLQNILYQVLGNPTQDYLESSMMLAELGWKKENLYFCQVLRLSQKKRPIMSSESICSYIEETIQGCCAFVFRDDIVVFYHLDNQEERAELIENQLKIFVRDSLLKAGYSRITAGHMHIRRMYQQALIALDIGNAKAPHIWIHHFNQLVMEYILDQITAKMPGELLCHGGVMKLREMDSKNGTEYIETLRVWLKCQGNATEAARELFIHRSTLLYRMERIREIMDSELNELDELTYIGLSVKLLERL